MSDIPHYDHVNPITAHDILWSWSQGHLPTKQAEEMLHLEADESIYEVAQDNAVPFPADLSGEQIL